MKKNNTYLLIFVAVALIVGSAIMFNIQSANNTIDRAIQSQDRAMHNAAPETDARTQKEIDVMKDVDIEADLEDVATEEDLDLGDIEVLMTEETVTF